MRENSVQGLRWSAMTVELYMYEREFAMGSGDLLEAKYGWARCGGSLQVMPIAPASSGSCRAAPGWRRE